ncbi:cubilin-like isoform X1 [Argiope bruennichi]|uniref:cubilin-like isoform X1 n=1 Tax=Argiope bruennichi TaxID=94029 RepID=UPI00249504A9|nr:cubilin-like isoform X1 [Argiope bruennichi]
METFYVTLLILLLSKQYVCQETTTLLPTLEPTVEVTSTVSTVLATTVRARRLIKNATDLDETAKASTTSDSLKTVSSTSLATPVRTVAFPNCDKSWSSIDYELVHPGFPDDYSNGMLCRYSIRKHSDSICGLEITFKKFDLETSAGCEKDFLAIGDERLCGNIPADSVVQYPFDEGSNHIPLVFGTNDNGTKGGFQILFQQISICEEDLNAIPAIHACDVLITDPSGELVTHRSPEDALGDPVCRYTIGRRHSGYCHVELDFVDFNVEYSPGCIGSYVQLDGHRFCGTALRGQRKNVTFDALGNVHIVYKTDTVRMDRGFHLLFRQLVCPPGEPVRSPGGSDLVADRLPSSCSKIYYEKEFYLESPGFPNYYANDLDCQLVIRRYRPSICKMDIRFLDFDVEDSPGCVYDYLQLDAQRLCGRIPEDNVKTTDFLSFEKVLRFKTDSINPRPGFFLYVRQLDCGTISPPPIVPGSPSSCDVHVWDVQARVTSPNYPRDYGNDLRCRYTVHRQGEHICQLKVTFLDFKLQNGNPGCYNDYLELDGGWRACGDKFQGISRTLDFRTPEKVLFFSTDAWYTFPGFLLALRQVPCTEVAAETARGGGNTASCDRELEALTFDIRSELYPLNYLPNLNCRYVIRKVSAAVCQLRIRFIRFDLEASIGCSRDYLALDGERLCGALSLNTTRTLRFDAPEKVLVFHTDSEVQGAGFIASVQQVECPGGLPPDTATVPGTIGGGVSPPVSGGGACNRHYTDIRASFNSPNYPSPYPLGVACRYAIHVQPGFCNVEFNFIDFSLEPPTPGLPCTRDYVDIAGVRYCGTQLRGVTKLEPPFGVAKEVVVTFVSDSFVPDRGFLVSYRQVPCGSSRTSPPQPGGSTSEVTPTGSVCGGHLTGPFFEIKWPDLGATGDYGQTVQCVYTVHRLGSDTCSLRVTFVTFDFGDGRDCPRQFAQIGTHTLCGRLPSYTTRDYDFFDYTMAIQITSSQLPRPRMLLQVQQLPCGASSPASRLPPPTCDETFQGPGFELRSPYYPHGLTASVNCRYIVRKASPFICNLELTFERFELPDSRHCYASHLRIDADRLCGSITPYTIRLYDFHTSEKLIHFSADHVLPGAGFLIKGRQVPCGGVPPSALMPMTPVIDPGRSPAQPLPSSIRCDQSFGLEEFTIYSPNHPLPYPVEVHCRYVIIRSSSDICGLEVTFVSFDIEDYYQCQKDYLDIDGERLCGVLPSNSVRNYIFHPADRTKVMVFKSDYSVTKPGFALRIRQSRICPASVPSLLPAAPGAVSPATGTGGGLSPSTPRDGDSNVCGPSFFSSPRGVIRSPRFPGGYPASHCIYTFLQLRGFCTLKFTFRDFDLLPGSDCIVDYLELDGRRYCDGQLFQQSREVSFPWSDSSTATLMFHSDRGSFVHRGFHVDFEQVLCRRQGRQNRDELDQSVAPQNSTVRSASSPTLDWTSSLSSFDADWDDSKTTPRNSSVEYV